MQEQHIQNDCPYGYNKRAHDEDHLHAALDPFVDNIGRYAHAVNHTEEQMRGHEEIQQTAAHGQKSLVGQ